MPLLKTLIDDGEAAWDSEQGANVVCTADADHKVGTKSAKMAISAGIGAALLATQDIVAGATDYSGCHKTRKWIKSSIDTTAGQLQLLLDATVDCPTPEETLDVPALTANTWHLVDIALANPASDGAIVSVGLKQTAELGALDFYIDDFNGCVASPEYQRRVALGYYAAGGKFVPIKVDANGELSIVATVADIVTAYITHWGDTALTGRDISLDLKALIDDSTKGVLKSIGDVAALENLITRIGQTTDVVVAAGAAGSNSAKLRRLTTDLDSVKTEIGALADAIVAAGAVGSMSAKLRRLTSDLGGILTNIDVALSTIAAQSTLVKIIPIVKAAVFNTALPAAEADILGADITPTNSPSYLRIYVCVAASGILRVAREVDGVTIDENLNGGTALTADAAYMFTIPWRTGDAINFEYSVTDANILRLLVDEIGGAE